MNRYLPFLFSCVFLLATGCSDQHENSVAEEIIITTQNIKDPQIDDIFHIENIIRLSTGEDHLVGEVRKALEYNGLFFVSDGNRITVFNGNGNYQYTIDRQGRSGQEYSSITDFHLLNDRLIIMDKNKKNLLFYSIYGDYENIIFYDFWASSFVLLNENTLIVNSDYDVAGDKFHVYDINTFQKLGSFYEIPKEKMSYMHFLGQNNFSYRGDKVYFNEAQNEEIYELSATGYTPVYCIYFKDHRPPSDFRKANYEDVRDYMTKFLQAKYMSGSAFFMEQNDKFLFSFGGGGEKSFMGLYDKQTGDSQLFYNIDIDSGVSVPTPEIRITTQYDGSAILPVPVEYLFDEQGKLLTDKFDNISINDNSILYKFNLK